MKRRIPVLILVLLATAPSAEAKETAVQVCGVAACNESFDPGVVGPLRSTFGRAPAPKPAPFYVVRFCSGGDCEAGIDWSYIYVPSAARMRADNIGSGRVRWMQATLLAPSLRQLTSGLEPFPATRAWRPIRSSRASSRLDNAWLRWVRAAVELDLVSQFVDALVEYWSGSATVPHACCG